MNLQLAPSQQAVDWELTGETVSSPDHKSKITLLHRFHFNSTLKRMAAIVRLECDDEGSACASAGAKAAGPAGLYVVAKGAPEVLKGLLGESPPCMCSGLLCIIM